MNKEDLRQVQDQLDGLEALARLFKNLWYEQLKRSSTDAKVQAYLTVFEDAFPSFNYVIDYVKSTSEAMAAGDMALVQQEFEALSVLLLNRDVEAEQRASSSDSIFSDGGAETARSEEVDEELHEIGVLMGEDEFEEIENESPVEEARDDVSGDDSSDLLDDDSEGEEEAMDALLEGGSEDSAEESGGKDEEEDLDALLEDETSQGAVNVDDDGLDALLEDGGGSTEESESVDEFADLLEDVTEAEDAGGDDGIVEVAADDGKLEIGDLADEKKGEDDESISQDEIDALFG